MKDKNFWLEDRLSNIIPRGFGEFPEGFDVIEYVRSFLGDIAFGTVVDLGCGYGRLCQCFCPEKYLGLDVNPEAIAKARTLFPMYQFKDTNGKLFPKADLYFSYTLFLHLTDEEIHYILDIVDCSWFVVAEILGHEWRRDGLPPVYNREFDEYLKIFKEHGFSLHMEEEKPYARYADDDRYLGKNTNINFLCFHADQKTLH